MNYHNITYPDMNNGEGLRVVLWLSGCSHKCKGCQNPQTWDANSGIPFDESAKEELFRELDKDYISGLTLTGGDPLFEKNLDGVLDLVTEVNKRYNTAQNIARNQDKNHNILNENANKIRLSSPQKSIWLYTGYRVKEIYKDHFGEKHFILSPSAVENWIKQPEYKTTIENGRDRKRSNIIKQCNILVDDQYVESQRDITIPWVGSSNQRVISVKESLQKGEIVLWQT